MKEEGVWRTIRGRRIFIGKGEDLATAMKNSGKFSNQMSRVKKNKDKYDIIQKAKNFDKDLKKTNRERYDIDKSHEKDKWEEQEKYKARHNTKEAQRYEKNEYKKVQDFKAKKQSNNKVELSKKQIEAGNKLNAKAEENIRNDIREFTSGRQDYDGSRDDFINDLSNEWNVDRNRVEDIVHEELSKHPRQFKTDRQSNNKVVKDINGVPIDQNWAKEQYSGMSYEDIKRDNDWEKENRLENIKPEYKPMWEARIRETDKYLENMPKYESRISDDFGTKEWDSGYPLAQNAWKGTKSNSNLYGKDKIKAIDDDIKKAYPEVKTSRTTERGGYTDSFSYSVLESDTPVIRNIEDFSDTELNRLYNKGYNSNYYKSVGEYKEALAKELQSGHLDVNQYNIDDDERLTPYGKQLFKDIVKVSNAYNFDESDAMTDYFHTGHYLNLHVGKSGKPFKLNDTKAKIEAYKKRKGK